MCVRLIEIRSCKGSAGFWLGGLLILIQLALWRRDVLCPGPVVSVCLQCCHLLNGGILSQDSHTTNLGQQKVICIYIVEGKGAYWLLLLESTWCKAQLDLPRGTKEVCVQSFANHPSFFSSSKARPSGECGGQTSPQ